MTATLSPTESEPAAGPPPPAAAGASGWNLPAAGASLAAVLLCSLSLHGVLDGWSWLAPVSLTALAVVVSMAAARRLRVPTMAVPAAGLAALAVVLTWLFGAATAVLGLIPTGGTLERASDLLGAAQATVMNQVPPVLAESGIVFITCVGVGLVTLLVDTLATTLRMPAASGLGLFSLLIVPAVIKPESVGAAAFFLAAAGYLLVLGTGSWQDRPRSSAEHLRKPPRHQVASAAGIGAAALTVALALPAVLPGFDNGAFPQGSRLNIWSGSTGLNPVVALGNDLRQPASSGRILYATDSSAPTYLRSTTLEDFSGRRWAPDLRTDLRQTGLDRMSPAEGDQSYPSAAFTTTKVRSQTYASPWLLAPYAPRSVSGAPGQWTWDPTTMTVVAADNAATPSIDYEVQSLSPELTPAVLADLGPADDDAVAPVFTSLPDNLPDSIRDAVRLAVGDAETPYEQAMAIQSYLRGPAFRYSLDAPVEGGYDGNGIEVLDKFMQAKSGYCVHFAAAMAVMAREAGIPSRMALGFAPGRATGNLDAGSAGQVLQEYEVDSRDAHAWPELYFQGVGWVRFEPTPSRGAVPAYAVQPRNNSAAVQRQNDDPRPTQGAVPAPATPAPSQSAPPVAAPVEPAEPGSARYLGLGFGVLAAAAAILSPWALRARRTGIRRRLLTETSDGETNDGGTGQHPAVNTQAGIGQPLSSQSGSWRAALSAARQRVLRLRSARAARGPAGYPPPGPSGLAWDEAADLGQDYGYVPERADSPRTYAARLVQSAQLADGPASALERLRAAYEQEVYAAPAGAAGASAAAGAAAPGSGASGHLWLDVMAVREGLRSSARPGLRLRAKFFPASLASRFRR